MRLIDALRLSDGKYESGNIRLAFTGAGGKSSALFCLGRELAETVPSRRVLLTTTTHLLLDQTHFADHYYMVNSNQDMDQLEGDLLAGVNLVTGKQAVRGGVLLEKVEGLGPEMLEKLRRLADNQNWPLLIEADGSRRRPLKAPAEHEPVVPAWVNNAVVVAGLSGINQPLSESWVHRPERFARISGLSVGDPVTPESLVRVLVDPAGGLWNLPEFAQKTVLLNQASSDELSATGKQMSEALLKVYERVIIADLPIPGQGKLGRVLPDGRVLPGGRVLPSDVAEEYFRAEDAEEYFRAEVSAVHEKIAGIILAAGGSQRMGRPKQLLEWKGKPFVRHVVQTALAAGLEPVILVVGAMASEVMKAVEDLPVQIIHNPAWETGQSSSLICGMNSLHEDSDGGSVRKMRNSNSGTSVGGVVFLLADQPQILETLVRALRESHAQTLSPIVAPQSGGRRGNPVLFDRCVFDDLLKLSGDVGGRALFSMYPVHWLPWLDESILQDIDTTQDYERFLYLNQ